MVKRSTTKVKDILNLPSVFIEGPTIAKMVLDCRPSTATGAYAFKWKYLEKEILSKYVGPDTDSADLRRARALEKMLASEQVCRDINEKGYGYSKYLQGALYSAQVLIADILGDIPRDIFVASRFTGGATTSKRRTNGSPYYKYNHLDKVDVTPRLRPYAEALVTATPMWCSSGGYFTIRSVLGNKITTVPKKSDIDRAIAMEPDMNQCMQAALGSHIRGRLKTFGIDLNDQSRNQRLALFGSKTGLVSTIDLSAASDSISCRLVQDLLPPAWFELFDVTRSHRGTMPDGTVVKWEKFSSMGNGFTFELESMIFYALMVGTYNAFCGYVNYDLPPFSNYWKAHTSVYGDDIICPSFMSGALIEVLAAVGFKTNTDKTFIDGTFRESCGKHYFAGYDVTPFYVRKPIDHTNRVIWFLNKLREWSYCETIGVCDPSVEQLWLQMRRKYVPQEYLGGRNIGDDSCVYSIETPRKRLINLIKTRRIGGYRAFLARAQDWGRGPDDHYIECQYASRSTYVISDKGTPMLCKVVEHTWKCQRNVVHDPVTRWSRQKYLFPKEIR